MKQEKGKKNKKWIWLAAALAAVLVITGILLAIFLLPGQQAGGETVQSKLYWNIDRLTYTENSEVVGMSTREPGEDGQYHVRFAVDGEQVELTVADKQLINYIDSMDVMGLVMDTDGVVIDALDPKSFVTELAIDFYVQEINGSTVTVNSSQAMNGMPMTLTIGADVSIYDVSPSAQTVGTEAQLDIYDLIKVYSATNSDPTHVFITKRVPAAGIYWRVEQKYDAEKAETTRVPDENGVYTILFAHEGQQVELKCKDKDIVNAIDKKSIVLGQIALVFDEEGYIVDWEDVAMALRGKLLCQDYHVTALDGNTITATKTANSNAGATATFTLDESCDIYLCDGQTYEQFVGERTAALQINDRIVCYSDMNGKPILVFISRRMIDGPMYYNIERKYANGETTRKPDANGYYVFEMLADHKKVTLRTKDKAIATRVDKEYNQFMGLKVNGSIIERVYLPRCVSGEGIFGAKRYVTSLMGTVFTVTNAEDFTSSANGIMSADCKIIDISNGYYNVELGEKTTVDLYDRVTCYKNIYGEISYVYVTDHYVDGAKVYYNLERKYSTSTKATTRTPDENGYYVYDMICDGKQVTVKTKNKDMASYVDEQNAPIVGMKVSGGIIKAVCPAAAAVKYGVKSANYHYTQNVKSDGSFRTFYISGSVRGDSAVERKLASDCKIYNVSLNFNKYQGEKTTLKNNDRIQAIVSKETGETVYVFVMSRKVDGPLYWPVKRQYNGTTGETKRVPDENGYYVIDLLVNGEIKQYKTKDKEIASKVDAQTNAFTMVTDGDVILNVLSYTYAKEIFAAPAGHHDVMKISGNDITVQRNRPAADNFGDVVKLKFAKNCKIYNVSSYAETFGAEATLSLGDRVKCYTNANGEVVACYIIYKNTHKAGHVSYCEHCGKDVWWEPYDGTFYDADAHYYLTHNKKTKQLAIGSSDPEKTNYDLVLDLNGMTWTSSSRNALVYGKFSVVDTAGGGKIEAAGAKANAGNFMALGGGVFNLYGGTVSPAEGSEDSVHGGVVYISKDSVFNMYGGTITGGHATGKGDNVYAQKGTFNMYGGTVNGGVYIETTGAMSVAGKPVINGDGMVLAEGVKIKLGQLEKGASLAVKDAWDFFTEKNDKCAEYLQYFVSVTEGLEIICKDNALYANSIYHEIYEGTCSYCGKVVTWEPLYGDDRVGYGVEGHYYLSGDVNYTGATGIFAVPAEGKTLCLYLNGHNVESVKSFTYAEYANSTLNIMGEGTIRCSEPIGVIRCANATATINIGEGVTIDANNVGRAIRVPRGVVNIDGATIKNGIAPEGEYGGNIYVNGTGTVAINSGKVTGGSAVRGGNIGVAAGGAVTINGGEITYGTADQGGNIYLIGAEDKHASLQVNGGTIENGISEIGPDIQVYTYADMVITGGTFNGEVRYANATAKAETASTLTMSGAPVITGTGLRLPSGLQITDNGLTTGASIAIYNKNQVFVTYSDIAAAIAAKDYFTSAEEGYEVVLIGTSLKLAEKVDPSTEPGRDIANAASAMVFTGGEDTLICPVCNEEVTWTPVNNGGCVGTEKTGHFYLAENVTYTEAAYFATAAQSGKLCLHLNGKDLATAWGIRASTINSTINIMGSGNVSSTGGDTTTSLKDATIKTTADGAKINVYGGTYTSGAGSVVFMRRETTVSIFADTVIDGNNTVRGILIVSGTLNINGGTIQNGFSTGAGGNIRAYGEDSWGKSINVTINGGTIKNGSASTGGNIYAVGKSDTARTNLTINGGTIGESQTLNGIRINDNQTDVFINGGTIGGNSNDAISFKEPTTLSISGTPVIGGEGLNLPEGHLIIDNGISEGASIAIYNPNQIFVTYSDAAAAEAAKGYFVAVQDNCEIVVEGSSLKLTQEAEDPDIPGDEEVFNPAENGGQAKCPVCGTVETWTALEGDNRVGHETTGHYYLSADVNYTSTVAEVFASVAEGGKLCIHLNGHNVVTVPGIIANTANSTLNIMGEGTIKSSANPVISCANKTAVVNIEKGVVVDGNNAVRTIRITGGTLNLNGCTVQNGNPTANGGNIRIDAGTVVINQDTQITGGGDSTKQGGNIYVAGSSGTNRGTLIINGGTIKDGIAGDGLGEEIRVHTYADVTINGGTIDGEVSYSNATATAATASTLTMSGAPVITGNGLRLPAGLLVTDNGLTTGASVAVYNVDQVFATYADATAAEAAKGYFTAANSDYEVVADGSSLKLAQKTGNPGTPGDGDVFNPAENGGQAKCPVCGSVETWTALEGDNRVGHETTGHYYLSADVNYTSATAEAFASVAADGKLCIHLNGHNIVTVPGIIANTANSTLNIMGEGTIKSDANPVISCANKTAVINIEAGVVVDGDGAAHRAIRVNPGTVNLNGCTIQNGKASANGCNINVYGGGTLVVNEGTLITGGGDGTKQGGNIYVAGTGKNTRSTLIINGGTIENGQASSEAGDEIRVNTYADVTINGGTINGEVSYANATATASTASTLTMSGAPVITRPGLRLPAGVLVTDNGLTTGASVAVYNADQVFATYADAAAAEAARGYFTSARGVYGVVLDGSSLKLADYTAPLSFEDGTTNAVCVACGKVVTWTAVDQAGYGQNGCGTINDDGTHLYLAEDITYTGTDAAFITAPGHSTDTVGKTACLHLNGHNITATSNWAVMGGNGILNILGTGTVSGNYSNASVNRGSTLYIDSDLQMGTINLYGGTYVQEQGNTQEAVASIMDNGGKIIVNVGAKLVGNVHVGTANTRNADFVVNGGIVEGSVNMAGANAYAGNSSTFTMAGGSVSAVILKANNGAVLSGAAKIGSLTLADGVMLTLGDLTTGTSIVVSANGAFTQPNDKAADYAAYFTAAVQGYTVVAKDDNVLYCEASATE